MEKTTLCIMFSCLFISPALALYTHEVYTYGESKILNATESILVDQQGGMYGLTLTQSSSATINGTSALVEGSGGIWQIELGDESHLDFSDGQVHRLDLNINATAVLTGGLIEEIWSYQNAWAYDNSDPPALVPNPHITIIYSGDLPTVDVSNILTGLWGNGGAFSIQLHDITGYDPVIENIQFIPEPATLALFCLGGLLLRRRK